MIAIAVFVAHDPDPICAFVLRWGSYPDADLQSAIASCLLERLLEFHFERVFPDIEAQARRDRVFADTFSRCWKYGQADEAPHAARFDALLELVTERRSQND